MAEGCGVEAHIIGGDEAGERWPLMRVDDVLGAVWLPHDGKVKPEGVVNALATGAKNRGAAVIEGVRVDDVIMKDGRARGVRSDRGDVAADWVILCCGMWTRQLGLKMGLDIPLHPVEHHYIVSEPIEGVISPTTVRPARLVGLTTICLMKSSYCSERMELHSSIGLSRLPT